MRVLKLNWMLDAVDSVPTQFYKLLTATPEQVLDRVCYLNTARSTFHVYLTNIDHFGGKGRVAFTTEVTYC